MEISTDTDIDVDEEKPLRYELEKRGWSYLGRGVFGVVFSHPDKEYVLKLYKDKAYDEYIEFIKQHSDNPHVVKVKDIDYPKLDNTSYKLIAIEKLTPMKWPTWVSYIAKYYNRFLDLSEINNDFYYTIEDFERFIRQSSKNDIEFYKISKYIDNLRTVKKSIRRLSFFVETHIDLFRILYELNKFRTVSSFDLHEGNFMKRPSTGEIVVTDPLCINY